MWQGVKKQVGLALQDGDPGGVVGALVGGGVVGGGVVGGGGAGVDVMTGGVVTCVGADVCDSDGWYDGSVTDATDVGMSIGFSPPGVEAEPVEALGAPVAEVGC